MPNEVLRKSGDNILFAHSDLAVENANWVLATASTLCLIDLHTLATTEVAQSDKIDLGVRRAPAYAIMACIEFATTPGGTVDFYWAPSPSGTAAVANIAGLIGVHGTEYVGVTNSDAVEGVKLMQFIGQLAVLTAADAIQIGYIGTFSPAMRYGQLVVVNSSGQAIFTTDDKNNQILMQPIIDEVQ